MPTWTQEEIDSIKAKVLSAKSVAYADKSLVNHDLEKLTALLSQMEQDNSGSGESGSNGRSTLASTSRA